MNWRYADANKTIVYRMLEDGGMESCLATREDVVAWMDEGNIPLPFLNE